MSDVFYEVDEQLRSARLQSLFRRNWPYAAGVLVLILVGALGVWAWRTYEQSAQAESSTRYGVAMQALSTGDQKTADAGFAALAKDGTPTFKSLALMQQAGVKLKAEDAVGAAALLDDAAAAAHDKVTVDAAKLKAAYVLMDTAPYADIRARLLPLTAAGRPYRLLAREALAMAELASGRLPEAKGDFQVLALSPDVSDATRGRANAALSMIASGAGVNLAAIARGAVGLKAAPPPAQGQLTPEQAAALARIQAQQAQGQQAQGQPTQGQPAQGQPAQGQALQGGQPPAAPDQTQQAPSPAGAPQ